MYLSTSYIAVSRVCRQLQTLLTSSAKAKGGVSAMVTQSFLGCSLPSSPFTAFSFTASFCAMSQVSEVTETMRTVLYRCNRTNVNDH